MTASAWRLAGYTVGSLIGTGSTSEVHVARDNATGQPVAVRRIRVGDARVRRKTLDQAALLFDLDHPHLLGLHDVRQVDDEVMIVTDLASGGSLAAVLGARGRLPEGEVITALAPIAAALAHAHEHAVVHGDLTPGKILFTGIGLPLLGGLGVAHLLVSAESAGGASAFIDPAVALGAPPDPATDVFMLGAIALAALTGLPPWTAGPAEALDAAGCGVAPDFAALLRAAGVGPAMVAPVARTLAIDPGRRGTAAEFAADLRRSGRPVAVALGAVRDPSAGLPPLPPPGPDATGDVWAGAEDDESVPGTAGRVDPGGAAAQRSNDDAGSRGTGSAPDQDIPLSRPAVRVNPLRVVASSTGYAQPPAVGAARARLPARSTGPAPREWRPGIDPASMGDQARHSARRSPPTSAARPPVRSRTTLVAGAAALVITAVVVAVSAWRGPSRPVPAAAPRAPASATPRSDAHPGAKRLVVDQPGLKRDGADRPGADQPGAHHAESTTAGVETGGTTATGVVLATLDALDRIRAAAFARRRPALLDGIYASAALRARDQALVTALVPPGCGLRGVRTSFTVLGAVRPVHTGPGWRSASGSAPRLLSVRVRARVRSSVMICAGRPAGGARAAPPAVLDVVLVPWHDRYRIAAERLAGAP